MAFVSIEPPNLKSLKWNKRHQRRGLVERLR